MAGAINALRIEPAKCTGCKQCELACSWVQTGVALGPWRGYLHENPLDLRRAFVASGAAQQLLESTLLAGRAATGGGFRFQRLRPRRPRSPHHATLLQGAP